jgi:putative ABC transport system permease protein
MRNIGLVVAVVGVAAVTREAVQANLRELGIRAALGAAPLALVRLALAHAVTKVALGLALGLPGPFLFWYREATRGLRELGSLSTAASMLLLNPLVVVPTLMAIAAVLLAAYLPARRAGGLDLLSLVRAE